MQLPQVRLGPPTALLVFSAASVTIVLWVVIHNQWTSALSQPLPARSRHQSLQSTMDVLQFDDGLFVSAAYWDARATPSDVKVIAYFRKGRGPGEALTCSFGSQIKVNATYESASAVGPKAKRNAWIFGYIRCVVNVSTSMATVTLSSRGSNVSVSLPIRPSMGAPPSESSSKSPPTPPTPPRGLFLCTKSLYGSLDALRLIEWIELHLLLGVRHIYVYSYGINADAVRALERYESLGVVTLVRDNTLSQMEHAQPQFKSLFAEKNLERATGAEPFMQLQLLSLHDCLFRYGAAYEYMIVCDTDEVFVPRRLRTLPELAAFERRISPDATTFTLFSAPYLSAYETIATTDATAGSSTGGTSGSSSSSSGGGGGGGEPLHMLRYTKHGEVTKDLHKSFHSTNDTLLVGQHNRARPAGRRAQVAGDVAWVHHYRNACKHKWCNPGSQVADDGAALMGRYAADLRRNVRLAASELRMWRVNS